MDKSALHTGIGFFCCSSMEEGVHKKQVEMKIIQDLPVAMILIPHRKLTYKNTSSEGVPKAFNYHIQVTLLSAWAMSKLRRRRPGRSTSLCPRKLASCVRCLVDS